MSHSNKNSHSNNSNNSSNSNDDNSRNLRSCMPLDLSTGFNIKLAVFPKLECSNGFIQVLEFTDVNLSFCQVPSEHWDVVS